MYDVTNPEKSVMQIILTPAISVRILQEMIHRKDFVLYRSRKVWNGNAHLLTACEVSGTVASYELLLGKQRSGK